MCQNTLKRQYASSPRKDESGYEREEERYEHFSVVLLGFFFRADPISSKLLILHLSRVLMGQHHDVLICKNVATPSAQLSNYLRFHETFLWLTHAVAYCTDPWLLKWQSVCLLSHSRSYLPTRTSKIPVFFASSCV